MADASYAVNSFLGGEISNFAQGRFEKPDYKISLNVCLNGFPVEIGPWVRRPGSQFAGAARGGNRARVLKFDFEQSSPVTLEFTDGFLRFRQGPQLVSTNDAQAVVSISSANPAVVTVASAWPTGQTVMFNNLGTSCPLLQNRQFTITHTGTTTFTLQDALTGANIDGSTLGVGGLATTATVSRIHEVTTPYFGTALVDNSGKTVVRAVQAETTDILLTPTVAPQALTVTTLPMGSAQPQFALAAAKFNDGPYLDPFINGVQATPNQTTGVIQVTLGFPAYVATTSYKIGDFVTSSSVNYESLVDQNVGNTPVSSPSQWVAVNSSVAINNGQGFLATDVGRLVRLFSEPAAWAVGSTYATGNVVSYNPTGVPGAATYWQSLVSSNTGNIPGTDLTHWELCAPGAALPSIAGIPESPAAASGPAQWTWGKITGLINTVPNAPSGIAHIGTMTGGGGLAAAFNGNTAQAGASSAELAFATSFGSQSDIGYVGQNYGGCSPSSYAINSATIFPSTDLGLAMIAVGPTGGGTYFADIVGNITVSLYGSNTPPSTPTNGTLLGSTVAASFQLNTAGLFPQATSAVTVQSSNTTSTFQYLWVVIDAELANGVGNALAVTMAAAQVQFINAAGTGASANGVNVELIGPPLLYTTPIQTWRLGVYSNTTGFPTCGCYTDGRLWLGGAVANRFDACVSNGIVGSTINFAPTDQYGTVSDSSGISYTLNSDSVNPIFWMQPDQQGIIVGTQANEYLLAAPGQGGFTPTNITARKVTRIGCANVQPVRTEHTNLFVQRFGVKLMEYFPDVFSGKFTAPNLADKAQHITRTGIEELGYQQAVTPIVWGRCGDGSLFGMTYKRDTLMTSTGPTFYAWHRHTLGSGRIVESICDGPSVDGNLDALTMVTNQLTTADPQVNIRHVEILTDTMDELTPLASGWFLDNAVIPSSTVVNNTPVAGAPYGGVTLNGLWHLNGEKVTVFAGGLDCGDYTVATGSVFVPFGDGVSAGTGGGLFIATFMATNPQIVVGFTYTSQGQIVRPLAPLEAGTRNGPALGKKRRVDQIAAMLSNTGVSVSGGGQGAISFGTSFAKLFPAIFRQPNGTNYTPLQTWSGVWWDTLKDENSFDGMTCWQITRPYPANVVSIEPFLHSMDK